LIINVIKIVEMSAKNLTKATLSVQKLSLRLKFKYNFAATKKVSQ